MTKHVGDNYLLRLLENSVMKQTNTNPVMYCRKEQSSILLLLFYYYLIFIVTGGNYIIVISIFFKMENCSCWNITVMSLEKDRSLSLPCCVGAH